MVKINGKEAADVCGMTVSQYLSANNYNPKHIVVELNEEILPKTEYDSTAIADGDVVEILSFMGGGLIKNKHFYTINKNIRSSS